MTIDECITYFAMIFKEPLEKNYGSEDKPNMVTNPQLISTKRWLDDHFVDNTPRLERFCYYVEEKFEKKSYISYPMNNILSKLFIEFQKNKSNIKPLSQIEYEPLSDEQKKEKDKRRIKFFKECPEKYLNTDIEDIKKISKGMSFDQQLDEFGFNLFGELHSDGVYSRHGRWVNRNKKVGKDEVRRMF